jgi:hypothetical protein
MIDVMHHLPPASQQLFFLKAAERVKPGGMLIYKDMCSRPMWRAWANRGTDLLSSKQWIHYVPIRQIETWGVEARMTAEPRRNFTRWGIFGHELLVFRNGG